MFEYNLLLNVLIINMFLLILFYLCGQKQNLTVRIYVNLFFVCDAWQSANLSSSVRWAILEIPHRYF